MHNYYWIARFFKIYALKLYFVFVAIFENINPTNARSEKFMDREKYREIYKKIRLSIYFKKGK